MGVLNMAKQIHRSHKKFVPKVDGLLTTDEFMDAFMIGSSSELYSLTVRGLPQVKIGKFKYFNKQQCHLWFAGKL